ncbi:hypothetical protein TanjilG_26353 [Lupinus angustifolius]|uniref:UDP-glucuronate decarboxylase n=1 Tax=Lupinus angustifolius TaxID=3871 RepID=A0A4P1R370_LUPAN|nr:hypothetical protein TanjilG_26353 [Lupinus angustifolius]
MMSLNQYSWRLIRSTTWLVQLHLFHYKFNPVKTIKTNMLGLAKRVGARFLLTSTSEVYGDPLQHPQAETYWGNVNPIGVRSCYDEGKRTAETLAIEALVLRNKDPLHFSWVAAIFVPP